MEYKVVLSPKKIVSKEFKVDFKGYNADEVDHFLDQVVKDYEAFAGLLNNSYDRIEQLERRLADQKAMIARLEREKALQDDNLRALEDNVSSNVDILKHHRHPEQSLHHLCGSGQCLHGAGLAGRHRLFLAAVFRLFRLFHDGHRHGQDAGL